MDLKIKYAEIPVKERESLLKETADFKEPYLVKRPYLENEIDEFSRYVVGLLNKITDLEEQLAELSQPLKDEMKKHKLEAGEWQNKVRTGYEVKEIEVFGFKDYVSGLVEYFTAEGVFQYSRRLMPGERQGAIFPINKTGTND